nr:zinc finger protein [Hymenolepis microstoma]
MDMKTFAEIAPNVTITNCDSIPPNSQLGCTNKTVISHTNTNDGGSRGSSPLSNEGSYTSPISTSRPLSKVPSQALFSRRYVHPRRFICNQCRDQFSSLTELTRHTLEVHNSFRCNYCNAKFTQRSNLQRHSLKHVGFKPFTCNVCSRGYCRKDHLVRHIESVHPNVDPRLNITTHLHSSECLEFLEKSHLKLNVSNSITRSTLNGTNHGSVNSPATSDEELMLTNEVSALLSVAQEGTDRSIDQIIEQSSYQPLKK